MKDEGGAGRFRAGEPEVGLRAVGGVQGWGGDVREKDVSP